MIAKERFNINHPSTLFCRTPELIENYEEAINDTEEVWVCHHRDECKTLPSGIMVIRTKEELEENGRYYDCPPNELIFLRKKEHAGLHIRYRNLDHNSDINKRRIAAVKENSKKPEYRKKLSESLTGIKKAPLSEEHKKRISEANKIQYANGRKPKGAMTMEWTEERRKQVSERFKGKPKSLETRRKISEASKNRRRDENGHFIFE